MKTLFQGQGLGSKMLHFLEQLAPIQVVGLVCCRTDIEPMYLKRGYKIQRRAQITDHISSDHLTGIDVDFCTMVRNTSNRPLPKVLELNEGPH